MIASFVNEMVTQSLWTLFPQIFEAILHKICCKLQSNSFGITHDLTDYKGMLQNIVWSKRQIDIESRHEILRIIRIRITITLFTSKF